MAIRESDAKAIALIMVYTPPEIPSDLQKSTNINYLRSLAVSNQGLPARLIDNDFILKRSKHRLKDERLLNVTNVKDKHVECIDMFSLLASDNIRFRLGVLRRTVFYEAGPYQRFYVDDDIINTYFQRAFRDANRKDDEELRETLNENRLSYIMHFINRKRYEGYGTSSFTYLQDRIKEGYPVIFVSAAAPELTEDMAHTRLRMLLSSIARFTDEYWPNWHYAIIGDEDVSSTAAIWSDRKGDIDGMKMSVIAAAFDRNITSTLAVEEGYADILIMDGHFETFELGEFEPKVLKMYLEANGYMTDEDISQMLIQEKWVEPMREVFKENEKQKKAFRRILEYNGFDTTDPHMDPDDIDNLDWYRLFKLATDTSKRIVPEELR